MRVYVPDPKDEVIRNVLKELYLLRQAIDYQSGTPDSRIKMVNAIRAKLSRLIETSED
tara:strand:- start:399 stop:572 length:174 start_codon:yes stop_codon:yes gene_type:complete